MYPRPTPSRPFGMPKTPFNPMTGKYMAFGVEDGATATAQIATITGIERDYLETDIGRVEKPYMLQATPFDGKDINGCQYAWCGSCQRKVSYSFESTENYDGKYKTTETQRITPDYLIDEVLVVLSVGDKNVDINTAGRCWAAYEVNYYESK